MRAKIICVGTELLRGNCVNTNSAYLARQLESLGITVAGQSVVGDIESDIKDELGIALKKNDIVLLTGGLGPTQDDITKECVCEELGLDLVEDEAVKQHIIEYFDKNGKVMCDNSFKQALVPNGCRILDNKNGTAPGLVIEKDGKIIILLPGVPYELEAIYEFGVKEILSNKAGGSFYTATVKVCDRCESEIAQILADLMESKDNVSLATYVKPGEVHLVVTAKAATEADAKRLVKPIVKEIKLRLGNSVYTTHEDVTLEQAVVDLLIANDLKITTVESCTGGLIAGRLINVPGVSDVYKSGVITYSNKAKRRILGVKKSSLEKYGAVSEQVAKEMAQGAAFFNRADVAISVSGIAGPDGGTAQKPVGLVYIGCSVCGQITVKEYHFSGDREKIRNMAVAESLILMRKCILEYYSKVNF